MNFSLPVACRHPRNENADLKTHRGLVQLTVRCIAKARCLALWCALTYNLMHFGVHLTA